MKDEVLCIICAKPVDTLEISEGGSPDGCEIQGNFWVCSRECYDDAMRIGTDEGDTCNRLECDGMMGLYDWKDYQTCDECSLAPDDETEETTNDD